MNLIVMKYDYQLQVKSTAILESQQSESLGSRHRPRKCFCLLKTWALGAAFKKDIIFSWPVFRIDNLSSLLSLCALCHIWGKYIANSAFWRLSEIKSINTDIESKAVEAPENPGPWLQAVILTSEPWNKEASTKNTSDEERIEYW